MKTTHPTNVSFNQSLNYVADNTEVAAANNQMLKYVKLLFVSILFISLVSCSRGTTSGCGAWPMMNVNNNKAIKHFKNSPQNNVRQYAYYR